MSDRDDVRIKDAMVVASLDIVNVSSHHLVIERHYENGTLTITIRNGVKDPSKKTTRILQ